MGTVVLRGQLSLEDTCPGEKLDLFFCLDCSHCQQLLNWSLWMAKMVVNPSSKKKMIFFCRGGYLSYIILMKIKSHIIADNYTDIMLPKVDF